MRLATPQEYVETDGYRITRDSVPLICELNAAVAVCVYDDTQGVGGLLHLRFVAKNQEMPPDLTDNTLSSDLLLLDRFCKALRAEGARKQSWRVRLIAHIPKVTGMETPAATLLDLLLAYFADSRLPVEHKAVQRTSAIQIRFDPREGKMWMTGESTPVSS